MLRPAVALTYNRECGTLVLKWSTRDTATIFSSIFQPCLIYSMCDGVNTWATAIIWRVTSETATWPMQQDFRWWIAADIAGDDSLLTNCHHWIWKLKSCDNWGVHWERKENHSALQNADCIAKYHRSEKFCSWVLGMLHTSKMQTQMRGTFM